MRGQMSDNNVSDCLAPLLIQDSSQEREKRKPKSKLENNFLQLRSIFSSASEVGQEAKP